MTDEDKNNREAERAALRGIVDALLYSRPQANTPEAEDRHVNALRAAKRMLVDRSQI